MEQRHQEQLEALEEKRQQIEDLEEKHRQSELNRLAEQVMIFQRFWAILLQKKEKGNGWLKSIWKIYVQGVIEINFPTEGRDFLFNLPSNPIQSQEKRERELEDKRKLMEEIQENAESAKREAEQMKQKVKEEAEKLKRRSMDVEKQLLQFQQQKQQEKVRVIYR